MAEGVFQGKTLHEYEIEAFISEMGVSKKIIIPRGADIQIKETTIRGEDLLILVIDSCEWKWIPK